ncbi:Crp/Fnr family transcriptional regulator [Dyadobacter luticola]|uniref:Crp/Fnr family transcriptional regulator n=1 Tax=Dyadobacter luticola TaxID=1979387 RepID=A0A5R9KS90_9BACT|nr:Crp/Fnr family transcriptional regulator [Dyadobacter luticola]TLU99083.1 Crp/Fnr family transcriptional regulator [Dyadobacter luticola]
MYSELVSSLSGLLPISDTICAQLLQKFKIIHVRKGKLLLSDGEICDKLWFVKTGLVRGYQLVNNLEGTFDVTEWFAKENDFFHASDSFVNQVPACEYIEVLETSTLIYVSRHDLYQLYSEHPEMCCLGRIIAERALLAHKKLLRDMRILSAPQKFEAFRGHSKELIARVPQKYIASYLGISENYVSKLKAKYL